MLDKWETKWLIGYLSIFKLVLFGGKQYDKAYNSKYNYLLEQNKKYMNLTALSFEGKKIIYEEMHDNIPTVSSFV